MVQHLDITRKGVIARSPEGNEAIWKMDLGCVLRIPSLLLNIDIQIVSIMTILRPRSFKSLAITTILLLANPVTIN